jgi:hypothetical protein
MTAWDFLDKLAGSLPPIIAMIAVIVMAVVFVIGFSKHGVDFVKHGFKQTSLEESLDKRFNAISESFDKRFNALSESFDKRFNAISEYFDSRFKELEQRIDGLTVQNESFDNRFKELEQRIDGVHTELAVIKINHFGHLKRYLEILDGILLDKNIISNKEKAMLDNELKDM